ncbi:MAG: hypothetical protein R3C10_17920 [Pirellulales bacterium]
MKRLIVAAAIIGACSVVEAQDGVRTASATVPQTAVPQTFSMGEMVPTPEMWFYEQWLRQRQDPKVAVRLNAEFQHRQQQRRMAASEWFGLSNSRPTASTTPFMGSYSPAWRSNTRDPFQWAGVGQAQTVVLPAPPSSPRYGLW